MARRRQWWNGRFADSARQDVYLWFEDSRWHVEARRGNFTLSSRFFLFDDQAEAWAMVLAILSGEGEGWREVHP